MAKHKTTNVGITINTEWIELVQLSRNLKSTEKSIKLPMPMATIDPSGDKLRDPHTLATSLAAMVAELNAKPAIKEVHVAVPGTLVRIVEMPKIPKNELILALTSEAERYAIFNDTEALVDYEVISEEPDERQKIILVALRKDTVANYKEAFEIAKLKITSLEVETIASLRGFKYSGALETVLSEVGDQPWGSIHFGPERIRIGVWHYDQIKNWREVLLDTSDLNAMGEDAPVIQDLIEEVRRTIGMTRPAMWVTYGIAEALSLKLTSRLGAPVKPMLIGENFTLDDPKLTLAAIGTATKSYEPFPAFINIKPAVDAESSGELLGAFKIMLASAVILAILITVAIIAMMGISWILKGQLNSTNENITKQTQNITTLDTEVKDLQKRASIDTELVNRVNSTIKMNESLSNITNAIKDRIPPNLWIDEIKLTDNIEITGKSLDYNSIVLFSKNFDVNEEFEGQKSPIINMAIGDIEEEIVENARQYKFKIIGYPNI